MSNNPFLMLSPSMEDNDLNVTINAEHEGDATDEDIESLDTSDTPEAAELDLADAGAEVDKAAEQINEVDNAVEALENIYIALEHLQGTAETLDSSAVAMFKVAVNNATKKIPGLNYETMNLPSMESFESSPYSSLNVAMEGVGESIKKGWEAVVEFFKTWGNKFIEFTKSIFESYKASLSKAEKLKEKLSTVNDYNENGNVNVPAYGSEWFDSASKFKSHYTALADISRVTASTGDEATKIFERMSKGEEVQVSEVVTSLMSTIEPLKNSGSRLLGFRLSMENSESIPRLVKSTENNESVVVSKPKLSDMKSNLDLMIDVLTVNSKESLKITRERARSIKVIFASLQHASKRNEEGEAQSLLKGYRIGRKFINECSALEKTSRSALIATTNISLNAYAQALSAKQDERLKDKSSTASGDFKPAGLLA